MAWNVVSEGSVGVGGVEASKVSQLTVIRYFQSQGPQLVEALLGIKLGAGSRRYKEHQSSYSEDYPR